MKNQNNLAAKRFPIDGGTVPPVNLLTKSKFLIRPNTSNASASTPDHHEQ
jgi:hypothetical protein